MSDSIRVTNNEGASRFEADVDGAKAVLEYRKSAHVLTFLHTEVPPELEGRGVGSALAKAGLEFAKASNLGAVPLCSFVAGYVKRHPEYLDLVP